MILRFRPTFSRVAGAVIVVLLAAVLALRFLWLPAPYPYYNFSGNAIPVTSGDPRYIAICSLGDQDLEIRVFDTNDLSKNYSVSLAKIGVNCGVASKVFNDRLYLVAGNQLTVYSAMGQLRTWSTANSSDTIYDFDVDDSGIYVATGDPLHYNMSLVRLSLDFKMEATTQLGGPPFSPKPDTSVFIKLYDGGIAIQHLSPNRKLTGVEYFNSNFSKRSTVTAYPDTTTLGPLAVDGRGMMVGGVKGSCPEGQTEKLYILGPILEPKDSPRWYWQLASCQIVEYTNAGFVILSLEEGKQAIGFQPETVGQEFWRTDVVEQIDIQRSVTDKTVAILEGTRSKPPRLWLQSIDGGKRLLRDFATDPVSGASTGILGGKILSTVTEGYVYILLQDSYSSSLIKIRTDPTAAPA